MELEIIQKFIMEALNEAWGIGTETSLADFQILIKKITSYTSLIRVDASNEIEQMYEDSLRQYEMNKRHQTARDHFEGIEDDVMDNIDAQIVVTSKRSRINKEFQLQVMERTTNILKRYYILN